MSTQRMPIEALATFLANGWTPMRGRPPLDDDYMDEAIGILDFLERWQTEPDFRTRWSEYCDEVPRTDLQRVQAGDMTINRFRELHGRPVGETNP